MSQKTLSKLMFVVFGIIGLIFISRIVIKSHNDEDFINYYRPQSTTKISFANGFIIADIAVSSFDRQKGLSDKKMIGDNSGLLFVFENSDRHGFWMKDMNFPIDIVWIDENKKIVGISSNLSPETYPEIFLPPQNIKYALEINADMAKKYNLATGTTLSFSL